MNIQDDYKQHVANRKELSNSALKRITEIRTQIQALHVEEANIETILNELSQWTI